MYSLKKINIRSIIGDSNNPRRLDDEPAILLELSLSKYGLLSPLYITEKGLILSGHQRTKTLKRLGEKFTYVNIVPDLASESATNAVNFAFNKEMQEIESFELPDASKMIALREMLESLPDLKDRFKYLKEMKLLELVNIKEPKEVSEKLVANSALLYQKGRCIIPLILDEEHNIINGVARYWYYKTKFERIPCVVVPKLTPDVFRYITAQYSFKGKEDNIRLEQRRHVVDHKIDFQFVELLMGRNTGRYDRQHFVKFLERNLREVFDFGSGNGKQTVYLRQVADVNVTLFEPFAPSDKGQFSLRDTHKSLTNVLDRLESGVPIDMIRMNAVLNSVPFAEDRVKVVNLLKFLANGVKVVIMNTRHARNMRKIRAAGTAVTAESNEENQMVTTGAKTKLQRFFFIEELIEMFEASDQKGYEYRKTSTYIYLRLDAPKYKVSREDLMAAVELEFGMQYHGRVFEDIKKRALEVFGRLYDTYEEHGILFPKLHT